MRLASLLTLTAALSFAAPSPAAAQAVQPDGDGATYERQAVGVRHLVYLRRDGATSDSEGRLLYDGKWDAFAGPDHHPIDEEAFFRIVGRDDLLRRYHRESTVKKSLTFGGGALIFGGLLFAAFATEPRYGGAQPAIAARPPPVPPPIPGLRAPSGASPSPAPAWSRPSSAIFLDPTPIDADAADALARSYDRSLQSRLGISETAARE